MNFIHSIKFRFTIWYLVVLAVLLSILGVSVYYFLSMSLYNNLDSDLKLRIAQVQSTPNINAIWQGEFQEELGEIVMLCYYNGDTLETYPPGNISLAEYGFIEQAIGGVNSFDTVRTAEGERMRFYAVPVQIQRSPPMMMNTEPAAIVVGRSTKDIEQALDRLVGIFIIAFPLTMVVAAGGGVFLARRALKPVDEISQTALTIGESDLNQRIEVNTKDELGRLAATLNQMLERLQKALKRQQQLTSDASHELRAPLAVIQAESSLALQKEREVGEYKQSLETVTQEAGHMSQIIDRLLILARADAGQEQLNFEDVDLDSLIHDLGNDTVTLCQQKGLELKIGDLFGFTLKGDKAMLRQLFLNLLDNAIKYTPDGGTISVTMRVERQWAAVAIEDSGVGIPAEDLPHIFERFYRVDKARSRADGSSGLGLSICQHIAEVHGGRIEVESHLGKGSTFTVWLPNRRAD